MALQMPTCLADPSGIISFKQKYKYGIEKLLIYFFTHPVEHKTTEISFKIERIKKNFFKGQSNYENTEEST